MEHKDKVKVEMKAGLEEKKR